MEVMTRIKDTDARIESLAKAFVARMAQIRDAAMGSHEPPFPDDLELSPRAVRVLFLLGDRGKMVMTELAAAVRVPLSTATRIVDRLIAKGLVERSRSEEDRRLVVIQPTEQGARLHAAARKHEAAIAYRMLEPLTAGEREILLELMGKLLAGLQAR